MFDARRFDPEPCRYLPLNVPVADVQSLGEERMANVAGRARGQSLEIGTLGLAVGAFHKLDGLQKLVRTCRCARASAKPHRVVDNDMGEARGNLFEVLVEMLKAAFSLDLAPGVGENGAIAGGDVDLFAELGGELVEPSLCDIGPDAEHVRIVGNLYL